MFVELLQKLEAVTATNVGVEVGGNGIGVARSQGKGRAAAVAGEERPRRATRHRRRQRQAALRLVRAQPVSQGQQRKQIRDQQQTAARRLQTQDCCRLISYVALGLRVQRTANSTTVLSCSCVVNGP